MRTAGFPAEVLSAWMGYAQRLRKHRFGVAVREVLTSGSLASMAVMKRCRQDVCSGSGPQTSTPADCRKTVKAVRRLAWSTKWSPENTKHLSVPSAPVCYRYRPRCWSLPDSQRPSRVLRADLSRVLQAPRLFSWRLIGHVTNSFKV